MAKKSDTKPKKSVVEKVKDDSEQGARRALIEELFNDVYSSRRRIYFMNFFRGIFFGFGSVLGGTLLVAGAVWILSWTVDLVPALGGFIDGIIQAMNQQ